MLFPLHADLKTAGTLPSLDMPHHLRAHEWCRYREGVTVGQSQGEVEGKKKRRNGKVEIGNVTLTDTGLPNQVSIPSSIPPNTRVTIKFSERCGLSDLRSDELVAAAVSPSEPREEAGYYWGYTVRPASSLSNVFTESPFDGGYDLTFGTSERGVPISSLNNKSSEEQPMPEFSHMLVVFGGVAGLEAAVNFDEELKGMGVTEPEGLFDYWVDLCPGQGSRTIRTEEAVWLGLMGLREVVVGRGRRSK